jgi:hypothetical protein
MGYSWEEIYRKAILLGYWRTGLMYSLMSVYLHDGVGFGQLPDASKGENSAILHKITGDKTIPRWKKVICMAYLCDNSSVGVGEMSIKRELIGGN